MKTFKSTSNISCKNALTENISGCKKQNEAKTNISMGYWEAMVINK